MNLLKSKRFYCVLALLAAPATLKALSDYYYTIVYYGSIGTSNYLAGSRTLGVGTNVSVKPSPVEDSVTSRTAGINLRFLCITPKRGI